MAIQNDHLDDPDYIHWFKQPIWSVSQVIFLIQGIAPPQEDWTNAQLIKAFPTAKRVLQEIKEYDPDWGKDPGSWLHYLSNDITDSWVAIMSSLLPTSLAAILDEEPDYNRFIGAIICDEKLALGDLVKYALRIGRKNFVAEADDYQAVLLSAASRLDVADGDTKALERKIVSVKKFVDKYPRNPQPIDDECSKWAEWIDDHPVLAAWVAQGGIEEQEEPDVAHSLARKIHADMLRIHNEFPDIHPHPNVSGEGRVYKYLVEDNESKEYAINDLSRLPKDVAAKKGIGNLFIRYGDPVDAVPFTTLMKAFRYITGR